MIKGLENPLVTKQSTRASLSSLFTDGLPPIALPYSRSAAAKVVLAQLDAKSDLKLP